MVMFAPKVVSAATYYVCYTDSDVGAGDNGIEMGVGGKPYYRYREEKYSKMRYVEEGGYTTKFSDYVVFESVDDNGVCSDPYILNGDKLQFSYARYETLWDENVIRARSIFDVEKYKKIYHSSSNSSSSSSDKWWAYAWKFLREGSKSSNTIATSGVDTALTSIKDLIFDVGNVIFILVTAFLGVKYIWGGVDSKFSVKNSLMTLVVAAIVFYGWDAVTNVLDVKELLTGWDAMSSHKSVVSTIYNTVMYIINFAAVGGVIYIGIKYMVAGAEGKSELKLKGIPVVMGIIMVYGTINLINFILKIVESL